MGIVAVWEDEDQTVIRMTFQGNWSLDELHEVGLQTILMIRGVTHPVYEINDFTETTAFPLGVLWLARDLNRLRPSNWAAGITVTSDKVAESLLETFGQIYLSRKQEQLYSVMSLDQAYALIDKLKQEAQV